MRQDLPATDRRPRLWLHAASVGEVQVARALIAELRNRLPAADITVSTMTEQGERVARRQLGDQVRCIFAPLDLAGPVRRTLDAIRPDAYVCLETELWPLMLKTASASGAAVCLLNGRLSERSCRRYRRIRGFMRQILAHFDAIAVITPADADRYRALGAEPARITVAGNAKYDLTLEAPAATAGRTSRWLGLEEGQPVLVAGSTHTGEEAQLIEAHERLQARLPGLALVVAPRHLERLDEVKAMLTSRAVAFDTLSHCRRQGRRHPVVLVDTMGDLAGLYSAATFVFCGGSLVDRGGHNVMEAAIWGRPVFYGPHMKDFADAKELLEAAGGGFPVNGPEALAEAVLALADKPSAYRAAAEGAGRAAREQQGAAGRQAEVLCRLLSRRTPPAAGTETTTAG